MDVSRSDRSLGELFADLSEQTAGLVQQEVRLAKAELSQQLSGVGQHTALIGAGLVLALAAVMAATAGIVLLLINLGLQPWVAAVITATAIGLAAFVLAQSGISALRRTRIAPVETLHSLKETAQWLKHPTTR